MRLTLLVLCGTLWASVLPAAAQVSPRPGQRPADPGSDAEKSSRYVPFPFEPDIERRVNGKLKSLESLEPFKELIDRALRDPDKFKLDPNTLKRLNLDDPQVQARFKDWARDIAKGKEPSSTDLKKLKSLVDTAPKIKLPKLPDGPAPDVPAPRPIAPPSPPEIKPEPVREWIKGTMEKAQDTQVGNWLRDSPAWRKAFEGLQSSMNKSTAAREGWGIDKLAGKLFAPEKLRSAGGSLLERLGKLKPPSLRGNWTMPSLTQPALPQVATPSVPTAPALGSVAVWLLVILLVALLAWQAARWLKLTRQGGLATANNLGPWPVDPRTISTRTDLVRAFDYLALLVLGVKARAWNHQEIARSLARIDADPAAARQLAGQYEQARYTTGAEMLTDADRELARAALSLLAELTTS